MMWLLLIALWLVMAVHTYRVLIGPTTLLSRLAFISLLTITMVAWGMVFGALLSGWL